MSTDLRSNRGPSRWWSLFPLLAIAAIVSTLIGLSIYFRGYAAPPYYGAQYPEWFGWPFFGFGWIFIPLFFIVIFFAFRWLFWGGWGWRRGWYGGYYDPALETLRERFARGEITKEQFDSMAKDLEEH